MSSACLPSPSMTDKGVNVRDEWGGVEEAAKIRKDNNSAVVSTFRQLPLSY